MTKAELIEAVAKSAKISKIAAGEAVDATKPPFSGAGFRNVHCTLAQSAQGEKSANRRGDQHQGEPHRRIQGGAGIEKKLVKVPVIRCGH
jgi:hypothetical protein